ncbi:MAG TPA: geranylgeranyl reductase family protein [Dehalococcoidia bacterium]
MGKYDVAVVGAGPAGSTTAYHLAKAGARVLLLDRAEFPREKPCGGGVTARAFERAPVDLTPVVEQVVNKVRLSYRLGDFFDYEYPHTLVYMTQRLRLDEYLLSHAVGAGAEFHGGSVVRGIELEKNGVRIAANGDVYEAGALVGADGANGIVARSAGLRPVTDPPVALEANFPYAGDCVPETWREFLALELGSVPGGYGWSFPKADHFNVGCGGWHSQGSKLRTHLASLRGHYGLQSAPMLNVRGHHLPTRDEGAPIVRGRALLVGDAAGLVDPMSGEGIYSAFVSGHLAAARLLRFLDGADSDLFPYEAAIEREIMTDIRAARLLRDAVYYAPGPCYFVLRRSVRVREMLCQLMLGETSYVGIMRRLRLALPLVRFCAARGRASRLKLHQR